MEPRVERAEPSGRYSTPSPDVALRACLGSTQARVWALPPEEPRSLCDNGCVPQGLLHGHASDRHHRQPAVLHLLLGPLHLLSRAECELLTLRHAQMAVGGS